jgi:hypothetical protein
MRKRFPSRVWSGWSTAVGVAIAGVILLKILERDLGSNFETVIFTALGAVLISPARRRSDGSCSPARPRRGRTTTLR